MCKTAFPAEKINPKEPIVTLKKPTLKSLGIPLLKAGGIIGFALLTKYVFEPGGGFWEVLSGLF